jgi:transcriptional regulator with XRE-family HTH domain
MRKKSEKIYQDLRRRVSLNLSRLRAAQRLTLMQLGEAAGLHFRHLQKIEAGDTNVTLNTIARLASGLGVDPWELVAAAPGGSTR